jgi:glucan phosphoethanolaminetransferase (alkaline phosphatase superfamily)
MASLQIQLSASAPRPGQLAVLTALSIALLVLIAAWAVVDARTLDGAPVWAKPAKFALSFAVLFGTLALVARRLSPEWRDGRTLRVTVAVMATAMIFEMAYMIVMAARHEASHFNLSTPFAAQMYRLMGLGAVSLMTGVLVFGIFALRDAKADLGPALRRGVGWGFILSFVSTLVTAGYMSAAGTHVGVVPEDAATLPLSGWSATVGDIRPAHFLALHAMQILPLAGLWFDRNGIGAGRIGWVAAAYAALTAAAFAQALAGMPLVRL